MLKVSTPLSNAIDSKYRRPLGVFCIVLSAVLNGFCSGIGDISCSLIKTFETGRISINDELICAFSPPYIYYFSADDWNSETRKLKILSINSITTKKDSFLIELPDMITIHYLPNISINQNYLIVIDDDQHDNFRYVKTKTGFQFSNKIKLPPHSTAGVLKPLGKDKFLFQSIYNYHPDENVYNTNLGVYDAAKDQFINFIHPELPCIGFSHFASNWTTSNDHLIALAYPCSYRIILFDYSLKPIDTINYLPAGWKDLLDNKIPIETNPSKINPKLLIDKLLPLRDTINRIDKIYFIDNSKLMVVSDGNTKEGCMRIDVFKTNQLSKPISSYENYKIKFSNTDTIRLNNLPLVFTNPFQDQVSGGMIYTVSEDDFDLIDKISFSEYNFEKDRHYENHDPQFKICIYKIINF